MAASGNCIKRIYTKSVGGGGGGGDRIAHNCLNATGYICTSKINSSKKMPKQLFASASSLKQVQKSRKEFEKNRNSAGWANRPKAQRQPTAQNQPSPPKDTTMCVVAAAFKDIPVNITKYSYPTSVAGYLIEGRKASGGSAGDLSTCTENPYNVNFVVAVAEPLLQLEVSRGKLETGI